MNDDIVDIVDPPVPVVLVPIIVCKYEYVPSELFI